MKRRSPYEIIKRRYVTEKAVVLQQLKDAVSNRSVARCDQPKYVFIVDARANKKEIATAIEEIYREKNVKVTAVNTINVKAKPTRQRKNKTGAKSSFKKAIVTFEPKDQIDDV